MPMNKERERFRRESLETTEDYQKRDVPFTKSSHFFRAFSFVAFRRVSCSLFERAEDDMLKSLEVARRNAFGREQRDPEPPRGDFNFKSSTLYHNHLLKMSASQFDKAVSVVGSMPKVSYHFKIS